MINLNDLTIEEKKHLLESLAKDDDVKVYFEMEIQDRLKFVLSGIFDMLTEYIKKLDKRHADAHKFLFHTSVESYMEEGEARVAAAMLRKIKEFTEDYKNYDDYDRVNSTLERLKKLKNSLVDNSFSNKLRGTRYFADVLRWESKLANTLEAAVASIYLAGLHTKRTISEERIAELDKEERNDRIWLSCGSWDKKRVLAELEKRCQEIEEFEKKKASMTDEELRAHAAMEFARMMMPSGNHSQEEIEDKMSKIL